MKRRKSGVSLQQHINVLGHAKARGLNTSMLYILGLDGLLAIDTHFREFLPVLTRHPLVNLMQVYQPHQVALRHQDAHTLDYYLKARQIVEGIFSQTLRPLGYDNYRSPWYSMYGDQKINNPI